MSDSSASKPPAPETESYARRFGHGLNPLRTSLMKADNLQLDVALVAPEPRNGRIGGARLSHDPPGNEIRLVGRVLHRLHGRYFTGSNGVGAALIDFRNAFDNEGRW